MSLENIYLGTVTGDKTGTPAKQAGQIINNNFHYLEDAIQAQLVDSTLINGVTTSSAIPPTGNIHAIGVGPGTYTNWGGVVVPANNIGTLSRVGATYSVYLTPIDLSSKVNVSDVVDNLNSIETTKPGSANNDRLLDLKIAQGTLEWTAKAFLSGDETSSLGKFWRATANTLNTDVPGTSSKWVEKLTGYLMQKPRLIWLSEVGNLTDVLNTSNQQLTVSWNKTLLLIYGNNKYKSIAAGSIVLVTHYDFAYVDLNISANTLSAVTLGGWGSGTPSFENPDNNTIRFILFQRSGDTAKRLAWSLLDETQYLKSRVSTNESKIAVIEPKLTDVYDVCIEKENIFTVDGVYLLGSGSPVWTVTNSWKSHTKTVIAGDNLVYKVYSTNNAAIVLFQNDSNTVISWIPCTGAGVLPYEATVVVPVGATKATITTFAANVSSSYYGGIMEVAQRIQAIESQLPALGKTIIVDKNLTENPSSYIFNTIQGALAVSTGADTIKLFGSEASPYVENSLDLPNGITIIGIGKPWIKGELTSSDTVTNIENKSTIDANDGCTLENLIVTAKNMRYPIHADFSAGNTVKNIKNCKFIHYGNSEAYAYHLANVGDQNLIVRAMSAWGGGTKAGDIVNIDGCYFESPLRAFSTHNNTNFDTTFGASFIKISNSEFVSNGIDRDGSNIAFLSSFHIQHLDSDTEDLVILDNVKINGYITNHLSGSSITHKLICNTPNLKQVWNEAGSGFSLYYDWGGLNVNWYARITPEICSLKNMSASTILRGKAVKLSGIGFDLFTSADTVDKFYGILMEDTLSGYSADIKHSGYLPYKYFANPTYSITNGADVSVDATGSFVQNSSHVVAKAVDNNNVLIN